MVTDFLKTFSMKRGLQNNRGHKRGYSYDFDLWPHRKMLKIILSENFEKLQSENRLRYSNEFFTKTFIEKIFTKRKIFV